MTEQRLYGPARVVVAEGARVGFVTCPTCRASILLDPFDKFDPMERHDQWHAQFAGRDDA